MTRTPTSSAAAASVVDSLLHPQAAMIRSLLTRAEDDTTRGLILIDDEDNILRALDAGIMIRSIFHSGDVTVSDRLRRQAPATARQYTVARRTCKKLFGNDKVSRVFAVAAAPLPCTLDALLRARRDIVVLDGVGIAGNVGAIIRTAAAMAAGGVALVNARSVDPFDRRVIRASRGCLFTLPIVTTTTEELIEFCAAQDLPLLVTTPTPAEPLDTLSCPRPLAIVLGAERTGCSPELARAAALRVTIPTSAAVQSLNVAAAAAITLYSRYRFNSMRP